MFTYTLNAAIERCYLQYKHRPPNREESNPHALQPVLSTMYTNNRTNKKFYYLHFIVVNCF